MLGHGEFSGDRSMPTPYWLRHHPAYCVPFSVRPVAPATSSSYCLFGPLGVQACQIRNPAHNIASFCVALPRALCRLQERHALSLTQLSCYVDKYQQLLIHWALTVDEVTTGDIFSTTKMFQYDINILDWKECDCE